MKGAAIVALFIVAAVPSASALVANYGAVSSIGRDQTEPGAPGGRKPIDTPVGTEETGTETREGPMEEAKLAQLITQGGAFGVLAVVLFFYRRDFFRKNEREREEREAKLKEEREQKEQLADLVGKSTAALINSAVATARQTDATHRLARSVESIELQQKAKKAAPAVAGAGA